ncbi:GTPase [uncultured Brachyspira sp.]|mgnify:CR=1 FL=1|uniref:GTPase n=1 Tax=uncultured Brachyspira sp. TaxID=221953 RepID=UPI00259BC995|nr:GTPase [uncultured Brachyspira sp.]
MTEEQKKKCEEIYNLHIDLPLKIQPVLYLHKDRWFKITILLAEVFNKNITEEEAEKIISINKVISGSTNPIKNNIATFWAIVNYFDKGFDKKQEQKKKEATKIEKIINLAEEKYKKEFEEINTFHFDIYGEHSCPIARMLFIPMPGLSFFENQFATAESWMEWLIFSIKSNYMAVKNIIDLTVALSEAFNKNMAKEEAEKLLFVKSEIPKENIENYSLPPCNYSASTEFRNILHSYHFNGRVYNSIFKLIGWAIANYFGGKENNNENEEENKNFNKENKINNVVENTAKEKIMSNNDELTLNLLILGKTGVGKSSLLNALVGKEVEETRSASKPVTKRGIFPHEAEIDGKKVIIHDSWGLEVGKDEEWEKIINNALKEKGIDKDIKDWFHSVTYCIQAGGDRIEDFDLKIIKKFLDDKYNVIVALTKADQINEEKEEQFINTIKKDAGIDTVVSISANPERKRGETEAPKPFGLPEYKAAILISWREIFINRIPIHIIEKLKKDIENSKSNAPRKGKDKELTNKIQEYFSNILNTNIQKYVRESIEKYYKINVDILAASKNINLSNRKLNSDFCSGFDFTEEIVIDTFRFASGWEEVIGGIIALVITSPIVIPFAILEHIIVKPIEIFYHLIKGRKEDIEFFINRVSEEYIEKIGEEEFESEIRKIIINTLNEIDKKIIKLN